MADTPEELKSFILAKIDTKEILPTDVLVIRTAMTVSRETAGFISSAMKQVFPQNPCIVMDHGMTLEIYRTQNPDALQG